MSHQIIAESERMTCDLHLLRTFRQVEFRRRSILKTRGTYDVQYTYHLSILLWRQKASITIRVDGLTINSTPPPCKHHWSTTKYAQVPIL